MTKRLPRGQMINLLSHCIIFWSKILYSHSASLHLGIEMNASEFNAGG